MKIRLFFAAFFTSTILAGAMPMQDHLAVEFRGVQENMVAKSKKTAAQIIGVPTAQMQADQQAFAKLIKLSTADLHSLDQLALLPTLTPTQEKMRAFLHIREGETLEKAFDISNHLASLVQAARDKAAAKR